MVGRAEWFQADGWLVAVTQRRPLTASLSDTQTLNVQHYTLHAGKTGLRTEGGHTEDKQTRHRGQKDRQTDRQDAEDTQTEDKHQIDREQSEGGQTDRRMDGRRTPRTNSHYTKAVD